MPSPLDPSRDLLLGLLALQTGLINQAQLVAAFHAWTQAHDRPMAEILAEQVLDPGPLHDPGGGPGRRAPESATPTTPRGAWRRSASAG